MSNSRQRLSLLALKIRNKLQESFNSTKLKAQYPVVLVTSEVQLSFQELKSIASQHHHTLVLVKAKSSQDGKYTVFNGLSQSLDVFGATIGLNDNDFPQKDDTATRYALQRLESQDQPQKLHEYFTKNQYPYNPFIFSGCDITHVKQVFDKHYKNEYDGLKQKALLACVYQARILYAQSLREYFEAKKNKTEENDLLLLLKIYQGMSECLIEYFAEKTNRPIDSVKNEIESNYKNYEFKQEETELKNKINEKINSTDFSDKSCALHAASVYQTIKSIPEKTKQQNIERLSEFMSQTKALMLEPTNHNLQTRYKQLTDQAKLLRIDRNHKESLHNAMLALLGVVVVVSAITVCAVSCGTLSWLAAGLTYAILAAVLCGGLAGAGLAGVYQYSNFAHTAFFGRLGGEMQALGQQAARIPTRIPLF